MEDENALETRPPTTDDLLRLCQELNRLGAKYIVVGGMAINQHGFVRTTEDIDLIIDTSPENQAKIKTALLTLPDKAAEELGANDLDEYIVVRVADEFIVDLMKSACGIDYAEAAQHIVFFEIKGVRIPMPNVQLLLRLKQTVRAKDVQDRMFLEGKLRKLTEAEK